MIQEVITLMLVALAISYSAFALMRFIYPGNNKKIHSCGLRTCHCDEIKRIKKNKNL